MRPRDQGHDAGIHDAEVVGAVDREVGVDDAAHVAGEHGAGARGVVLGVHLLGDVGAEVGFGRVLGRLVEVGGVEGGEGRGGEDALVELDGADHGGDVGGVGAPAGVDQRGVEGVAAADFGVAAGEGVLDGEGEAAGAVGDDLVAGDGGVGEAG